MTTKLAITHWTELADRKANFALAIGQYDSSLAREAAQESLQASCVADALRMTARTGIEHCSCTNTPHPITR